MARPPRTLYNRGKDVSTSATAEENETEERRKKNWTANSAALLLCYVTDVQTRYCLNWWYDVIVRKSRHEENKKREREKKIERKKMCRCRFRYLITWRTEHLFQLWTWMKNREENPEEIIKYKKRADTFFLIYYYLFILFAFWSLTDFLSRSAKFIALNSFKLVESLKLWTQIPNT